MDINNVEWHKDVTPHYRYNMGSDIGPENNDDIKMIITGLMACIIAIIVCTLFGSCTTKREMAYEKSVVRYESQHSIDSLQRKVDSLTHVILYKDSTEHITHIKDSVWQWRWQSDTLMVNDSTVMRYNADGTYNCYHYHNETRIVYIHEKDGTLHSDQSYRHQISVLKDSLSWLKESMDVIAETYHNDSTQVEISEQKTIVEECPHPWYTAIALWLFWIDAIALIVGIGYFAFRYRKILLRFL